MKAKPSIVNPNLEEVKTRKTVKGIESIEKGIESIEYRRKGRGQRAIGERGQGEE